MKIGMVELDRITGTNGSLIVYDDRVVISRKTIMGFMTQGFTGDRTIFLRDISSIEFRKATFLANGYIQFILSGTLPTSAKVGLLGSSKESLKDPNTIIFRAFNSEIPTKSEEIYNRLLGLLSEVAKQLDSPTMVYSETSDADELRKFKGLFDDGIISKEEFESKKKKILDD